MTYNLKAIRDHYEDNGWYVFPHDPQRPKGYLDPSNYPAPDRWFRGKSGLAVAALNGILGIDVDAYEGNDAKNGDQTLAALVEEVGEEFPATYSSTARGAGQPSRIYWFRVPSDIKFVSKLPSIETVQSHHRYGKVYPTVNAKVNAVYRWFTPAGDMMPESEIPRVADLAALPPAWIERLEKPERATTKHGVLDFTNDQLVSRMLTDGTPCADITAALDYYDEKTARGDGKFDSARDTAWNILHKGDEGHRGARAALDQLREKYVAYVDSAECTDPDRDGEAEFDRFIESAPGNMEYFTEDDDRIGCGGMLGCGINPNPELTNSIPESLDVGSSSWSPVDLSVVLADGYKPPRADFGRLGGTGGLFYGGEVNTIAGPSGTGKSWVAAAVIAETLTNGKPCLYVDHESTAGVTAHRLRLLGVPKSAILEHLTYVNPSDPHTIAHTAWNTLLAGKYAVAVIDGVTAAMSLYGGGTNDQDPVAVWFTKVPTAIARKTGAAVITVDHTSKTGESSGFAVGSQHKRAAVSGISYNVTAKVPLAPGREGELHLIIGKDRHGDVASRAILGDGDRSIGAILHFESDDTGMAVRREGVLLSSPERTAATYRRNIMAALEQGPQNTNALSGLGNRNSIGETLREMVESGEILCEDGPRNSKIYSLPAVSAPVPVSSRPVSHTPIGGVCEIPVVDTSRGRENINQMVDTSHDISQDTSQMCPTCGESMIDDDTGTWFCFDCDESEAA